MAALPYMQLYIADYLADTMHLSTEEHGAYLLLMFNYWQTGKPIPKSRLAKIARVPNDRWSAIEQTLSEFFEDDGECWIHFRIERDMESVVSSSKGKKYAGDESFINYKGKIYFITSPELDVVKIGYSKNPWARLSELRSSYGSSIRVVATINLVAKPNISVATVLSDFEKENSWFVKNECVNSLISEVEKGKITTVEAISDYVESYRSSYENYDSESTVVTTTTTNKDPDIDLKEYKNILSHGEKNATRPDEQNNPAVSGGETNKTRRRHEYPPDFEDVWKEYPRRPGSPDKHGAFNAWKARIREGATAAEILAGVKRYATYIQATGRSGTEFIKQAKAFFGPSCHYEDEWLPPKSGGGYDRDINSISQPDNKIPDGFRGA